MRRGIANTLRIKVSGKVDLYEFGKLIDILNPQDKPGRIIITTRVGAESMRVKLLCLIRETSQIVTWAGDHVHGNTIKAPSGLKTRPFDAIRAEVRALIGVHEQEGSYLGGVVTSLIFMYLYNNHYSIPYVTF
ncbi:hypothetical protein L1987_76555 [Smallanthus sonchifolius]|uniref:Uncharacterized protein n=1 Tax=Smallanthus sonchifolius TaxID=185202 RepID=A0ACB8Z7T2_9ASTR|nr:hypothetical protein L1987_76555 [Smallanthus sonchifolius]